ncbi:MAG: DUF1080 domain-containing protein, partial [Bryobacteraceae bacterium]
MLKSVLFTACAVLALAQEPQLIAKLAAARANLTATALSDPLNDVALEAAAAAIANAELALSGAGAVGGSPDGVSRGTIPNIREAQVTAITRMTTDLMPLTRTLAVARSSLAEAARVRPQDDAAIKKHVEEIRIAELAVARARAAAFTKIQASPARLTPPQIEALVAMGGSFEGVRFTQPEPLRFSDHEGYVSLFDGVSLKGWDGNAKFWRVEGGAIVGESTPKNPSGNSYLVYRALEARDFTLKFEIKVEGTGGSGFQYRSKTGAPWLAGIPANVTANVGPVNLNWMMTGPQADFWPGAEHGCFQPSR